MQLSTGHHRIRLSFIFVVLQEWKKFCFTIKISDLFYLRINMISIYIRRRMRNFGEIIGIEPFPTLVCTIFTGTKWKSRNLLGKLSFKTEGKLAHKKDKVKDVSSVISQQTKHLRWTYLICLLNNPRYFCKVILLIWWWILFIEKIIIKLYGGTIRIYFTL